jgi:hypothetical protein
MAVEIGCSAGGLVNCLSCTTATETIRSAQLLMNGRRQAVRLPRLFRLEGKQAYVKKVGA